MHPEQMRAARAILDWSLDQLSQASGVHRNTLSNFETRRYAGEPGKLLQVKRSLETAGVIFIDEGGEAAGARLRRFRVGDYVRFRASHRIRYSHLNIADNTVGTVIDVEPHPPATGPTYRMSVQFADAVVRGVFRFEFELVQASEALFLQAFVERSGFSMLPNSHFVANPELDGEPQIENDLARLPQALGSQIIIPTADPDFRSKIDACGFFPKEVTPALTLMWRNYANGTLLES